MSYRFEDYDLNLDKYELRRGGEQIPLEPQVFEVLAYLVRNHDRVVMKEELVEHVWPERFISDGALNSRMMAARKAIGDSGQEQRLIRTVHGRGFRFVGEVAYEADMRPIAATEPQLPEPKTQYATTKDGVSIAYAVCGSGPPLVRALAWFSHLELEWRWPPARRLWERLAERHTLIRYNGRGIGLSDPAEDFTIETRLLDLEAVIDATGYEQVDLLGISSGVADGVHYAARHPERVKHLIAYGGGPGPADPQELKEWETLRELRTTIIREAWGHDIPAYRHVFAHLFLGSQATPENLNYFTEMQRASTTPERAARWVASSTAVSVGLEAIAPQVRTPTLVLHRRGDQLVPFARSRRLAALIPGAQLTLLEGDNHWLLFDDPGAPEFVRAIDEFTGVG